MRILFAGGGTAGHINPALAIAGYVREKEPDVKILYIGAKGGMEERLVPAAGFDFKSITISGFQRKLSLKNVKRNIETVVHIFTSSREARNIIRDFQPDICVGTGGYVAGPVLREAMKMKIPAIIHEQNAYPGITNKMLSKHADKTMLAVADAQKFLDPAAKCVLTGNPVRQAVIRADRAASRKALGLDSRPLPAYSRIRPVGRLVPRSTEGKGPEPFGAPQYGYPGIYSQYAGMPGRGRSRYLPCRRDHAERAAGAGKGFNFNPLAQRGGESSVPQRHGHG